MVVRNSMPMNTPPLVRLLFALACTLGLLLTSTAFAADETGAEASRPPWEHLAFTHDLRGAQTKAEVAREIVRLGKAGWELVSVANFTESGTTTKTAYYFKRPLM